MSGLGGGRNALLGCLPNLVSASVCTVTSGGAESTMPVSNVQTEEPSEPVRLTSRDPRSSWIQADFAGTFPVDVAALVSVTAVPGGSVRFTGWKVSGSEPPRFSETLPPTSTVATSNTAGTHASIDEDLASPDGAWVGPTTTTSSWYIRVGFNTPAATPATGDYHQCFAVRARMVGTPASALDYPYLTAELREGAGAVSGFRQYAKAVTSTTGQILLWSWDAADLASADGSGVELHLSGLPGPGGGGTYCQIDVATWFSLSTTDVAKALLDSGWLDVSGAQKDLAVFGGTILPSEAVSSPTFAAALADGTPTVRYLRAEIRDDGSPPGVSYLERPPFVPDETIDAGVLAAGPAYELPYNFGYGGGVRADVQSIGRSTSVGGQDYAAAIHRRRLIEDISFPTGYLDSAELFSRLDYGRGGSPVLVMLAPDGSEPQRRHTVMWCTVAESRGAVFTGGFVNTANGLENELGHLYTFREKL